jgi:putative membrane protein
MSYTTCDNAVTNTLNGKVHGASGVHAVVTLNGDAERTRAAGLAACTRAPRTEVVRPPKRYQRDNDQLLFRFPAVVQRGDCPGGVYAAAGGDDAVMNGVFMGWMWIWPVLVLVGLVAIVAAVVLWARGGSGRSAPDTVGRARQVLDERFARGEIDEDQYRRMREALQ